MARMEKNGAVNRMLDRMGNEVAAVEKPIAWGRRSGEGEERARKRRCSEVWDKEMEIEMQWEVWRYVCTCTLILDSRSPQFSCLFRTLWLCGT